MQVGGLLELAKLYNSPLIDRLEIVDLILYGGSCSKIILCCQIQWCISQMGFFQLLDNCLFIIQDSIKNPKRLDMKQINTVYILHFDNWLTLQVLYRVLPDVSSTPSPLTSCWALCNITKYTINLYQTFQETNPDIFTIVASRPDLTLCAICISLRTISSWVYAKEIKLI